GGSLSNALLEASAGIPRAESLAICLAIRDGADEARKNCATVRASDTMRSVHRSPGCTAANGAGADRGPRVERRVLTLRSGPGSVGTAGVTRHSRVHGRWLTGL